MSEPTVPEPLAEPPQTGVAQIDQALSGLTDLGEAPLSEHHDRLGQAHDVLRDALSDQGELEPPAR